MGLLSAGIFFLQFSYERTYHPQMFYRVYLDDEIIGVIESRAELDAYINKQGSLIRDQVTVYVQQLETLEIVDNIIKNKLKDFEGREVFLSMQSRYFRLSELVSDDGTFAGETRGAVVAAFEGLPENYRVGARVMGTYIHN